MGLRVGGPEARLRRAGRGRPESGRLRGPRALAGDARALQRRRQGATPNGTPYADNRVDASVDYLEQVCGASVEVVAAERAYFRENLAETLTFATLVKDSTITTILAANDRMIKGALKAVDRALSPQDADRLVIAGFDWTEDYLLTQGLQVASGDQYMSTPFSGVWKTVVNVIDTARRGDGTGVKRGDVDARRRCSGST